MSSPNLPSSGASSQPSSQPSLSAILPPSSRSNQDLVLQLDEDAMWRIVVGVGDYLRNVEASQLSGQGQSGNSSSVPSSSMVSQSLASSNAGEQAKICL